MRNLGIAVLIASALVVAGCGSSSASSTGDQSEASSDGGATSVSSADLHQDSGFWLALSPSLRRELATICHDKQVKEAEPELVLQLQRLDVDDYVALITKEYEEQGEDSASDIEEACEEAKVEIAREEFEQIAPHLRGE